MENELKIDGDGKIVTMPITGWRMLGIAGTAILLVLQYAETLAQYETGDSSQIQLGMTPVQCLELAEALRRAGQSLLDDSSQAN
jgi:hypothetical protein